jgi:hypothetical protein
MAPDPHDQAARMPEMRAAKASAFSDFVTEYRAMKKMH